MNRDVKDLLAGKITEQQFKDRYTARGVGAAVGAAIVAASMYGPAVATAILTWATRNPDKVQQIANVAQEAGGGPPAVVGSVPATVESAATKLEGIVVSKAVNSELAHASERAFQHGFFSSVKEAGNALRALSKAEGSSTSEEYIPARLKTRLPRLRVMPR